MIIEDSTLEKSYKMKDFIAAMEDVIPQEDIDRVLQRLEKSLIEGNSFRREEKPS